MLLRRPAVLSACLLAAGATAASVAGQDPMAGVAERLGIPVELVERVRHARGMSEEAFASLPAERLPWIVMRTDYPDLARNRAAFRQLQQRDERGIIPPGALWRALQELEWSRAAVVPERLEVAGVPTGRKALPDRLVPEVAGLNPDHSGWTYLGPDNVGGRTRALLIHPTDPDRIWAGSVGGGIWYSANGGEHFVPVDDLMANLAVTTIVINRANPKTLYAGTGEGFHNADALRGAGIFRSSDGVTWKGIPATTTSEDFHYVNRLALSPSGKTLLAATRTGLHRSTDAQRATWTRTLAEELADVAFHPAKETHAVASTVENGRAYYSTDGGAKWQLATPTWTGRVELTYAAANPSLVYASVNAGAGQIWRSNDGGRTYERMRSEIAPGRRAAYLGNQGWYDNVIWAGDPTNADFVVVGGIDLWKSTDGGHTLVDISTWWDPRSVHADHHVIAAHPDYDGKTNRVVFFGNDGGVYRTSDIATAGNDNSPPRIAGWTHLNGAYGATQFYGGAGNVSTGTIIGGSQDNGTLAFTAGGGVDKWTEMFGGDGGWCAADPSDPDYFYGEYVHLNIHRSTDGGRTADFISGQYWNGTRWAWKPFPYTIPDAQSRGANFIAPFILDPNQPRRMLAGGLELWRTNDVKAPNTDVSGPKWESIKGGTGVPISAVAVASGDSNRIWVGHNDGSVFRTSDGAGAAPTWSRVDEAGATPLPNRFVTRIAIDPADHETVYVSFGGYTPGNVWKTTDGGKTWRNLAQKLPGAPVRALAIHPARSSYIYIGTEVGVFASEDGGATWSPTNEGPTNCSIDELFWMGNTLIAVTHGRGMFSIALNPDS